MPTRTYSRKTAPAGYLADPTLGGPSFTAGALTALPGRTWRCAAGGSDVTLNIDGGELTSQEDDDLTAAHTAWVPADRPAPAEASILVTEDSTITTSSKSHIVATGMTDTPAAGRYLVTWTASVGHQKNNSLVYLQVYAGGEPQDKEARFKRGNTDSTGGLTATAMVDVEDGGAVEGRWRTNSGTAEMYNRSLTIERV